ncbi:hypothetical protein CAPTEDRAFT_195224, partial [Capitella teleta]
QYLGCYRSGDRNERALNVSQYSIQRFEIWKANGNSGCNRECGKHGFTFAGTEDGNECYCDNRYDYGRYGRSQHSCRTQCIRNNDETCGGDHYFQIHSDINECTDEKLVHREQYHFPFNIGKTYESYATYKDCHTYVNECERGLYDVDCHTCVNLVGGHTCVCNDRYVLDFKRNRERCIVLPNCVTRPGAVYYCLWWNADKKADAVPKVLDAETMEIMIFNNNEKFQNELAQRLQCCAAIN